MRKIFFERTMHSSITSNAYTCLSGPVTCLRAENIGYSLLSKTYIEIS